MNRSLYRWKSENHPKTPSSIKELKSEFEKPEIIEKYGKTYVGGDNFYSGTFLSPEYDFTVFSSPFVMKFIEENIKDRRYLMDGTFDSLPKGFYQLLIISIEYQNDVSKYFSLSLIIKSISNRLPVHPPARALYNL